jgi:hypothetical protein
MADTRERTRDRILAAVQKYGGQYGVDPELLLEMIRVESGGDPGARSHKGALGLMQLMPATAESLGVTDMTDIEQNIEGGAKYMSQLLQRFGGDKDMALAAYNGGPTRLDRLGRDISRMPKESREYVGKVGYEDPGYEPYQAGKQGPAWGDPDLISRIEGQREAGVNPPDPRFTRDPNPFAEGFKALQGVGQPGTWSGPPGFDVGGALRELPGQIGSVLASIFSHPTGEEPLPSADGNEMGSRMASIFSHPTGEEPLPSADIGAGDAVMSAMTQPGMYGSMLSAANPPLTGQEQPTAAPAAGEGGLNELLSSLVGMVPPDTAPAQGPSPISGTVVPQTPAPDYAAISGTAVPQTPGPDYASITAPQGSPFGETPSPVFGGQIAPEMEALLSDPSLLARIDSMLGGAKANAWAGAARELGSDIRDPLGSFSRAIGAFTGPQAEARDKAMGMPVDYGLKREELLKSSRDERRADTKIGLETEALRGAQRHQEALERLRGEELELGKATQERLTAQAEAAYAQNARRIEIMEEQLAERIRGNDMMDKARMFREPDPSTVSDISQSILLMKYPSFQPGVEPGADLEYKAEAEEIRAKVREALINPGEDLAARLKAEFGITEAEVMAQPGLWEGFIQGLTDAFTGSRETVTTLPPMR